MSQNTSVAIVTGGAGSIGKATSAKLLSDGWRVALLDRREDALEAAVKELSEHYGADRLLALSIDQTRRDEVDAGIVEINSRLGPVTGLFANAGYGQFGSFLEISAETWTKHVEVNLNGTFNVCQSVARSLVAERRPGAFVLNASSGAWVYSDLLSAYCASKAGVRMLTVAMASELGTHRIRVNCVMPGVIESGMTGPMLADDRHRQWLLSETPVGRLGLPGDVASMVAFLLSDHSAFITGACVPIDGGQTIHGHPRWFELDYRNEHSSDWKVRG